MVPRARRSLIMKLSIITKLLYIVIIPYLVRNIPYILRECVYVYNHSKKSRYINCLVKRCVDGHVFRIHASKKNRQHNGQNKKHKRTNEDLLNIHIKLKIGKHEPYRKPEVNSGASER
jgi:hypothetical protein